MVHKTQREFKRDTLLHLPSFGKEALTRSYVLILSNMFVSRDDYMYHAEL